MTDKLQWLSTTSLPAQADPENPFYSPTKKSYVDYFPIPTRPDLDVSNIDEAVSILLFDLAWVFVLNTAALAGTQTMESYFYPHEVIQQKLKGQSLELWGAIHSEQVNITCGPSEIGDPANQSQGFSLFDYMDAVKKDYENTNPYQSAITAEMQMRYLTRCLISLLEMTAPDTLRTCLKKCDQYPACTKVAISCMRTAKEAVIIDECSIVEAMQPGKYSIMAGPERDKEKYSEFLKSFLEETPYRIENYRELNDPQHLGFY
ncbi:MAG: hypothetical protein Q4F23_01595, partial [Coriobacteriia bacterium]|nr:hypothetical protein [Coriobacteriia bacterium]